MSYNNNPYNNPFLYASDAELQPFYEDSSFLGDPSSSMDLYLYSAPETPLSSYQEQKNPSLSNPPLPARNILMPDIVTTPSSPYIKTEFNDHRENVQNDHQLQNDQWQMPPPPQPAPASQTDTSCSVAELDYAINFRSDDEDYLDENNQNDYQNNDHHETDHEVYHQNQYHQNPSYSYNTNPPPMPPSGHHQPPPQFYNFSYSNNNPIAVPLENSSIFKRTRSGEFKQQTENNQQHQQTDMCNEWTDTSSEEYDITDGYKLPASKSPVMEALVVCALRGWGVDILKNNRQTPNSNAEVEFRVSDFNKYYTISRRICSKQRPTDDLGSRIKSLRRWFKNFPRKRDRCENSFNLEVKPEEAKKVYEMIEKNSRSLGLVEKRRRKQ
jgi:hypothetical protein